jgi:hypothetical protein
MFNQQNEIIVVLTFQSLFLPPAMSQEIKNKNENRKITLIK